MPTIIDKTNRLIEDKNNNLLPKNLREGITALGVVGTVKENFPQIKTIAPTIEDIDILPDEGFNNFLKVYIDRVSDKVDPNFISENIKYGVRIFGKAGTLLKEPFIIQNKLCGITRNGTTIVRKDPEYDIMGSMDLYVCVLTGVQGPNGVPTSDANAEASDIAQGKIAFSKGRRLVGEIPDRKGELDLKGYYKEDDDNQKSSFETNVNKKMIIREGTVLKNEMDYKTACDKMGITPEKIFQGKEVLGVIGTGVDSTAHYDGGTHYIFRQPVGKDFKEKILDFSGKDEKQFLTKTVLYNLPKIDYRERDWRDNYYEERPIKTSDTIPMPIYKKLEDEGFMLYVDSGKDHFIIDEKDDIRTGDLVAVKRVGGWKADIDRDPFLSYQIKRISYEEFLTTEADAYGIVDGGNRRFSLSSFAIRLFLINPKIYDALPQLTISNNPVTIEAPFIPKNSKKKSLFDIPAVCEVCMPYASRIDQELIDQIGKDGKLVCINNSPFLFKIPDLTFDSNNNYVASLFSGSPLREAGKIKLGGNITDCSNMFSACNLKKLDIDIGKSKDISELATQSKIKECILKASESGINGYQAFSFTPIEKIQLPLYSFSNIQGIFERCENLKEISIDLDAPKVAKIVNADSAFCYSSIDKIPSFKDIKIDSGVYMFYGANVKNVSNFLGTIKDARYCFARSQVDDSISHLNFSELENGEEMFEGCYNLISPEIKDASIVTNVKKMFQNCVNLKNITISNLGADYLYNMFDGCSNLESISLSNIGGLDHMIRAHNMFQDCVNLKDISGLLPIAKDLYDAEQMFLRCEKLTQIPEAIFPKLRYANFMFSECTGLKNISNPISFPELYSADSMFKGCTNLTDISNISFLNLWEADSMFSGCVKLMNISNISFPKLSYSGYMFDGCTSLTEFSNMSFPEVDTAKYMFHNCTNLRKISDNVSFPKVEDLQGMFSGCTLLEYIPKITLPETTSVRRQIGDAFLKCPNLSDAGLDNALFLCSQMEGKGTNLSWTGLSPEQIQRCKKLSNYQACIDAGWKAE